MEKNQLLNATRLAFLQPNRQNLGKANVFGTNMHYCKFQGIQMFFVELTEDYLIYSNSQLDSFYHILCTCQIKWFNSLT